MERKERLYLLLAYGFGSLTIGFLTTVMLAFSSFPFLPGTPVAFLMTIGIFSFSFFMAARIVSKYMNFSANDVKFLIKLAASVGILLIAADILAGGAKFSTIFSNLSFLAAFAYCTGKFLKPKDEAAVIESQQQVIAAVMPVVQFALRMTRLGYQYVQYRWRNYRARYGQQTQGKSA